MDGNNLSQQQINQLYKGALASVALLSGTKPDYITDDAIWGEIRSRNVDHLTQLLANSCWTTENLVPLYEACNIPIPPQGV